MEYIILLLVLLSSSLGVNIILYHKQAAKDYSSSLETIQNSLSTLHNSSLERDAAVGERLSSVLQAERELHLETVKLSGALSNSQVRGRWGEVQLRRVVELAGMLPNVDFQEQVRGGDGDNLLIPDMVVNLPGGGVILIDSKAPMHHFLTTPTSSQPHSEIMRLHAKSLRDHVTKLSRKEYWKQFPSAEFVVLFLPMESLMAAAMEADPELFDYAAGRKIVLATGSTLLALLFAVATGWKQEVAGRNTQKITDLGVELNERLVSFVSSLTQVGSDLDRLGKSYKSALWALEKRTLPSARKLQEIVGDNRSIPIQGDE